MRRKRIQVDFRTRWFRPMALLPLALAAASLPGFGQQTYVSRFDLFTGYTHLDSLSPLFLRDSPAGKIGSQTPCQKGHGARQGHRRKPLL